MKMIEYMYFDLGNVLVHFDATIACKNLGKLLGIDSQRVHEGLYGSGIEEAYERGELSNEQFAQRMREELSADFATDDFLREMSAMFVPNKAIGQVLDSLRECGLTLGVLSNTCWAHWNWIQQQGWNEATGWYRDAVLSYEVGAMKPDPLIYQEATRLAGVKPNQIFFADDREENVVGALQAGWNAHVFTNVESLLAAMREAGVVS
jgi:FMN phosphatase YigB (HAD superfamily)